MKDKEYKRISRILTRLQKKWFTTLGFGRWKIRVTLYREPCEDNIRTAGECIANWEYQDVWLKFYVLRLEDMTEKEIEEVFVHECGHILVNETRMWAGPFMTSEKRDDAMHHEEHVVTQLTQALLWTYYDGRQEGKRESIRGLKLTKGKK